MFKLDYSDGKPIYEQIRDNLKQLIIDGILKTDEKIPSVRELAVTMAINPNTIQKAYKELEADGYVYTIRAKGVFVSPIENISVGKDLDKVFKNLEDVLNELHFLGVSKDKITQITDKIYYERRPL